MRTIGFTVCFIYLLTSIYVVRSFNLEPRIPIIKTTKEKESYFGFSVAEHIILGGRSREREPKILVGAPRAYSEQIGANYSGAIFECGLTARRDDCIKIPLNENEPVSMDEIKDDQWLGVTVRSQGPGGYVMACAHRYVKNGTNFRWGNGICYSLTQNLDYDTWFDPCFNRAVDKAHEQYGYCQAGTSGLITEDNSILIGTPGPFTWRGGIFVNSVSEEISDDMSWYLSQMQDNGSPVEKYSYLGMAVTSGRYFNNEMSFVAGAPRANNVGQVVFFKKEKKTLTLTVQLKLTGELFASSFGYEIASADLNNDGLPDLIVGAPFYYDKDIGGAIYVYMNSKEGISKNTVPVKITGKADSRFGFAIANCSDLNKDGFEDIAVGAPYEGKGAVYIYLGSKDGINKVPSQVIKAEALPLNIVSFGHSLSGGLDMDNNGYPDLIVGAYENDTVIMLRARPIINIVTTVDTFDIVITPNVPGCDADPGSSLSCFSFKTCFQITSQEGFKTRNEFKINYTIEAETFRGRKLSRVILKGAENSDIKHIITKQFIIEMRTPGILRTRRHCEQEIAYLKKDKLHDILTPVFFKLTYSLIQEEPRLPSNTNSLPAINDYPILNQQEASKIFQVNFEKDCGDDDICDSDLQMKAILSPEGTLVLGEAPNVTLEVTIFNRKESAYEAAVYVIHPESLGYIQGKAVSENGQTHCDPFNKTVIVCRLENPFKKLPEPTLVTIYFSPAKVKNIENQLLFTVFANSTSREKDPKPDRRLALNVVRKAKLHYDGKSYPEQVYYGGEIRGSSDMVTEEDIGSVVTHRHKLRNEGPWHISSMTLTIHWPYEIENNRDHGKFLLYLTEPPMFSYSPLSYGSCEIDKKYINEVNVSLIKTETARTPAIGEREFNVALESSTPEEKETSEHSDKETHSETRTETRTKTETRTETRRTETRTTSKKTETSEGSESSRKKRETSAQAASLSAPQKTVIFECGKTAKCHKFQCYINNLKADSHTELIFKSRLWNSTLVMDYPDVHMVQIITTVDIEVDPISKVEMIEEVQTPQYITTTAIPDIPFSQIPQEIPFWVYILAACIGILLLVLLILCLWKIGFFKRKKPGEMMKGNLEKRNEMNSNVYN